MDVFQKEVIGLIHAAIVGEGTPPSADFDWARALTVAQKHNIAAILYYGALNSGVAADSPAMQALFASTCRSMVLSQRQIYELDRLTAVFEEEQIHYMPLKGALLKAVYPMPEMRTMGDADILIRLDQYPTIEAIMQRLGYRFEHETGHEFVWSNGSLLVELHKSIMTQVNKDFYSYFDTGWKIAHPVEGCFRYEMTAEDFYLYAFVHFTKHYRVSGIGIKHLLDLWVYDRAHPELNRAYIAAELDKMHLSRFYGYVLDTIAAWFESGAPSAQTDVITNLLFESGQYGTEDMAVISRAMRDDGGSKAQKVWKSLFLPYDTMKERYAFLKKCPVALPVFWVVRWCMVLFCRRKELKRYVGDVQHIDTAKLDAQKKALYFVGLEFHEGLKDD